MQEPRGEGLPDRERARGGRPFAEGAMGFAFFMVIAFAMLGVERMVSTRRARTAGQAKGSGR